MTPDLWTYRAAPVRVIDGDTALMRLDLGFNVGCTQSLRLVGVHAPELFSGRNRAMGEQAKADCIAWFDAASRGQPGPWPFIVVTEKDKQTFGRFLGVVYDLEGQSLNDWLRARPWQEETP